MPLLPGQCPGRVSQKRKNEQKCFQVWEQQIHDGCTSSNQANINEKGNGWLCIVEGFHTLISTCWGNLEHAKHQLLYSDNSQTREVCWFKKQESWPVEGWVQFGDNGLEQLSGQSNHA